MTFGDMTVTDCDRVMNLKHIGSDLVDIWIRINPEIQIWIPDHFRSRLSALVEVCAVWTQSSFELRLLPRDVMHKRGLCRHAVSVCVSVTFVSYVKTNKDIFKIF